MVTAAIRLTARREMLCADNNSGRGDQMELLARELVAKHCHFHGRADTFEFVHDGDVLAVRGSVPSFYLKQMPQSTFKGMRGIRWIDNQVTVISCCGLSSAANE